MNCGLALEHRGEDMAVGRDFSVIHIEELIETLRINKIAKRKWADGEKKRVKHRTLY